MSGRHLAPGVQRAPRSHPSRAPVVTPLAPESKSETESAAEGAEVRAKLRLRPSRAEAAPVDHDDDHPELYEPDPDDLHLAVAGEDRASDAPAPDKPRRRTDAVTRSFSYEAAPRSSVLGAYGSR